MTSITFPEACERLRRADFIIIDNRVYKALSPAQGALNPPLVLRLETQAHSQESPMEVWFRHTDHAMVALRGDVLFMTEEHGEDAILVPVKVGTPTSVFATAETAAAVMDALHSNTTPQSEGSDSAYEEIYAVASACDLGFPGVWNWAATMALGARIKMEDLWRSGQAEFIDCVQMATQLLHNYVTDPRNRDHSFDPMPVEKAEEIWEETIEALARHEAEVTRWNQEQDARRMLAELAEATKNAEGFQIGVFKRTDKFSIEYTNYGGSKVTIRQLGNGLWRVGDDNSTDAPRPAIAFRTVASILLRRE